jgi:DNA-binding LytR/AlgR family response regulator
VDVAEELIRLERLPAPALTRALHGDDLEALQQAEALRPYIAFLDIRMPVRTGLEVAREIGPGCHIVFVTAYDEYAVAAFDEGAVDYILKPPTPERIAKVVSRLQARLAAARLRRFRATRRRQRAAWRIRIAGQLDADDRRRRPLLPARSTRESSPRTAKRRLGRSKSSSTSSIRMASGRSTGARSSTCARSPAWIAIGAASP